MLRDEWIDNILDKDNTLSQRDRNHIVDWLMTVCRSPLNEYTILSTLTVELALEEADNWTYNEKDKDKLEGSDKVKLISEINDELKLVQLIDKFSFLWEGYHMRHCVSKGDYFDRSNLYEVKIYSLRKKEDDKPVCTIEVKDNKIRQIRGKANGKVAPKFVDYVLKALDELNIEVKNDMDQLGYYQITNYQDKWLNKYFKNVKVIEKFNSKYVYLKNSIEFKRNIKFTLEGRFKELILRLVREENNFNLYKQLFNDCILSEEDLAVPLLDNIKNDKYKNFLIDNDIEIFSKTIKASAKPFSVIYIFLTFSEEDLDKIGFSKNKLLDTMMDYNVEHLLSVITDSYINSKIKDDSLVSKCWSIINKKLDSMTGYSIKPDTFSIQSIDFIRFFIYLADQDMFNSFLKRRDYDIKWRDRSYRWLPFRLIKEDLEYLYDKDKDYLFLLIDKLLNKISFKGGRVGDISLRTVMSEEEREREYREFLDKIGYKEKN